MRQVECRQMKNRNDSSGQAAVVSEEQLQMLAQNLLKRPFRAGEIANWTPAPRGSTWILPACLPL